MQRIRPAIDALHHELGLEYALASRRLYTDGAEIRYDTPRTPMERRKANLPASWSSSVTTSEYSLTS